LDMLNEKMTMTVKHCITWEVEGIRQRGHPKKSGWIVLRMTWKV